MEANADSSTPPDGRVLHRNSYRAWESAYKGACKQMDELLAEASCLHRELAGVRHRDLCPTRENQRLTSALKRPVCPKAHSLRALFSPFAGAVGVGRGPVESRPLRCRGGPGTGGAGRG